MSSAKEEMRLTKKIWQLIKLRYDYYTNDFEGIIQSTTYLSIAAVVISILTFLVELRKAGII